MKPFMNTAFTQLRHVRAHGPPRTSGAGASHAGPSKKSANKVKSKIQSSRLKKDYEFLKNLEKSLEKMDEDKIKDTANANDMNTESDQGEVVIDLVRDSITFLDHRAEFWTNMK